MVAPQITQNLQTITLSLGMFGLGLTAQAAAEPLQLAPLPPPPLLLLLLLAGSAPDAGSGSAAHPPPATTLHASGKGGGTRKSPRDCQLNGACTPARVCTCGAA